MNRAAQARHATWKLFGDAAAATTGFTSPLYGAALRARLGRDPGGEEFCELAARLAAPERRRLSDEIERLDSDRARRFQ